MRSNDEATFVFFFIYIQFQSKPKSKPKRRVGGKDTRRDIREREIESGDRPRAREKVSPVILQ